MALNQGPWVTYTALTQVVSTNAKTELKAMLDEFATVLKVANETYPSNEVSNIPPDFVRTDAEIIDRYLVEIQGMKDVIDAAP